MGCRSRCVWEKDEEELHSFDLISRLHSVRINIDSVCSVCHNQMLCAFPQYQPELFDIMLPNVAHIACITTVTKNSGLRQNVNSHTCACSCVIVFNRKTWVCAPRLYLATHMKWYDFAYLQNDVLSVNSACLYKIWEINMKFWEIVKMLWKLRMSCNNWSKNKKKEESKIYHRIVDECNSNSLHLSVIKFNHLWFATCYLVDIKGIFYIHLRMNKW